MLAYLGRTAEAGRVCAVVYVGAQRYYCISTLGLSWRQARAVPISLLPVSHHVTLDITACTLTMSSTVVEVTRVGFIGASAGCVRPQPRGLYVQPCWSRSSRPRWTPDLGVLHPPCRMCQQCAIVVMA